MFRKLLGFFYFSIFLFLEAQAIMMPLALAFSKARLKKLTRRKGGGVVGMEIPPPLRLAFAKVDMIKEYKMRQKHILLCVSARSSVM